MSVVVVKILQFGHFGGQWGLWIKLRNYVKSCANEARQGRWLQYVTITFNNNPIEVGFTYGC